MRVTRKRLLLAALLLVFWGALVLQFFCKPLFVIWLRANSTTWRLERPLAARLTVAIHQYPRLRHIPEYLGFGGGFVQLFDPESGRIFRDVPVTDPFSISEFAWGASSVTIKGVGEWAFPDGYEYQTPEAALIFHRPNRR